MSPFHSPNLTRPRRTIAAIAIVGLAAFSGCSHHRTAQPPSQTPPPRGIPNAEPLAPPAEVDSAYKTAVESIIAERLHLTIATITQQLRAQPDATLMNLAKPAGLAQDQLSTLIVSAFNTADDNTVRAGHLTQPQADQLTRYWTSQTDASLITEASYWYLHH